jgi:hypothetical protein
VDEWLRIAWKAALEANARADALELRVGELERRGKEASTPPEAYGAEVKSPNGLRVRASRPLAWALVMLMTLALVGREIRALWGLIGHR